MENRYLERFIDAELLDWSNSKARKPLLLRGARQVGKTSAIRKLANHFDSFIEVNFEEHRDIHRFFDHDLTPARILENLSVYFNIPLKKKRTLLFFDEVQSCVAALASLRFFYEKMPELHVIAAGSLLEFALQSKPSFGVGRIRSMFMYPISFDEFLHASGEELLMNLKKKNPPGQPLNEALHNKLVDYLKKFIILGGMPEVVRHYISSGDIIECQRILDDLIISYFDDFAKYKERVPATRISEVFQAVANQLGGKFVYSKALPSANHYQIKEAIDLLIKAGLVIPATYSKADGIPLGSRVKPGFRKMLMLDTGLAMRLSGLEMKDIVFSDPVGFVKKGGACRAFCRTGNSEIHICL